VFCNNCGNKNSDNDNFCGVCGDSFNNISTGKIFFNDYKAIRSIDVFQNVSIYLVEQVSTNKKFILKIIPVPKYEDIYQNAVKEYKEANFFDETLENSVCSSIVEVLREEKDIYLFLDYKDEKSVRPITSYPSLGKIVNDRYLVLRGIATGGFGKVYFVRDLHLPAKY